jgi:hypothetical protein
MRKPRLFHVSEEVGIARFEPRPPPSSDAGVVGDAVWAVAESHLANFLLPRDCPRICFRSGPLTNDADRALLEGAKRVVAFEAAWLARVETCTLQIYEMPTRTFEEALPEAGYWISRRAVRPLGVRPQTRLLRALADAGAQVRVIKEFWPLADAVSASSLAFSIIRSRNARPRA